MKFFTRLYRIYRINYILMRYNIGEILLDSQPISPFRYLLYLNPFHWRRYSKASRAVRIRLAIEALGPIFVKAAQVASTRRDLLPEDIAVELAKLQDRVPPFPGVVAKEIIEEALGAPLENTFSYFDMTALASASIAQVHAATLLTGESVVVKVLRPNIREMIASDVDLLMSFANTVERYSSNARQFKPKQIVREIASTLFDELDLLREGANASQLKRNFINSPLLYIPKIYWNECRGSMLVMERIHGIPIHDIKRLQEAGYNMKKLAENGMEIFFTQVFRDCFFHADLHPGNIFVAEGNLDNPQYIAVDFGIVGSLSREDQRYLAENMIAFFKRDYQRVAELHIASGWLPPDTRIDQFVGAIRSVSEPIFEQPLADVSIGKLLMRLFQVARAYHINIQPQLVLLQKTLINVEGLSRTIAPELDLWGQAAPQIEKWLKRQVGVKAFFSRVRDNLPLWSEQLPELPNLVYEVLRETKRHQEEQRFLKERKINRDRNRFAFVKWQYFFAGVLSALLGCLIVTQTIHF